MSPFERFFALVASLFQSFDESFERHLIGRDTTTGTKKIVKCEPYSQTVFTIIESPIAFPIQILVVGNGKCSGQ